MKELWLVLGSHLWQSTIVLALVAGAARVLRRAPAGAQEAIWTVGLVKLALPGALLAPLVGPLLARWGPEPGASPVGDAYALIARVASPDLGTVARDAPPAAGEAGWALLTGAWVVVAAGLMLRWWRRGRHQGDDGHALELLPGPVRRKVAEAVRGTGFAAARVRLREGAMMPGLRGLRRPSLQLSEEVVRALRPAELRAVVLHEEAHRRRLDVLRRWLERVVASLLFFYPPVWWLLRRLDRTAELACDEAVLRAGVDPRTYARALARTMRLRLDLADARALAGDGSNLGERLRRIAEPGRYPMKRWHRVTVAATLAAVAGLVVVPLAGVGSPLVAGPVAAASPGPEQGQVARRSPQRPQRAEVSADDFTGLDSADLRVDLEFHEASVLDVLERLAAVAGFGVFYPAENVPEATVSVVVRRTRVAEVLALLSRQSNLPMRVVDARTISVGGPPPAPTGQAPRGPMRVGGEIQEPGRIRSVSPTYPELARRARLEGTVILSVVVDPRGDVRDVEVLRGLGLGLDEAAVDAVRQWRYTPTLYNGQPVEVILTVTVQFELPDSEGAARTGRIEPGSISEGRADEESLRERAFLRRRDAASEAGEPGPGGRTGLLRAGRDVPEPERIRYVSPSYPEEARRARLEGVVVLQAVVGPGGGVQAVEVIRGLGLGLDEAAREAVRRWEYTPTVLDGRPVPVLMTVTVQFELVQ